MSECKVKGCPEPAVEKERCEKHLKSLRPGTPTAARPYIDYDYAHKLGPKERAWLQSFTREYYLGQFNHVLPFQKKLHKTKIKKRALHAADNARRRTVELTKCVSSDGAPAQTAHSFINPEDALIAGFDEFVLKPHKKQKKGSRILIRPKLTILWIAP